MRRRLTVLAVVIGGLLVATWAGEEAIGDARPGDVDVTTSGDLGCYVERGTAKEALQRPSPLSETRFSFPSGQGLLCYGAPSARGREIMGGLLVYGQPERIGANEPTTIHLSAPVTVGGVDLETGSYSIYAIAEEDEWQFFINSQWQRWGIPIDASVRATEIGTFTVPAARIETMVETLAYRWEPMARGTMGDLVLEWEQTRVNIHVHPGGD